MPSDNFVIALKETLEQISIDGTAKGKEKVVTAVVDAKGKFGPRYKLAGQGENEYLRMNGNSYLGMSRRAQLIEAEERAAHKFGVGPGAVRFISGTFEPHIRLEQKLAAFHGREDCMITSSAYTSVLGVIVSLATPETIIVSDELNHNCIINAMKLARPKGKKIYKHINMAELEARIKESIGECEHLMIITDGVFSMRGAIAPLAEICELVSNYNDKFPRDITLVVDDSHGVGALGKTGRGTEELKSGKGIDILIATLGKAFGVNGGYIVANSTIISYLREKNPFYIYTNPITPSEAAASIASVELLESSEGVAMLAHLGEMTRRFETGLVDIGYETIPSEHPVVPLMVRDTEKTSKLVKYLFDNNILATGLNFPVVPKGDQSIRFQVSADHTEADIDYALGVLKRFRES